MSNAKVSAYRRENGRVGIRNHVVILPLDDLSNAACQSVACNIKGTKAIPHAYGRLQFGEDLELFFRTMIGTGCNPNVAAVVVIGIEPEWTNLIVEGIRKTGKPVEGFSIERTGDIGTIAKASYKAKEFMHWASERKREECDLSEILGIGQMRGIGHHLRVGLESHRRQRHRQTGGDGRDLLLRRDLRDHRRRIDVQGARGHSRSGREIP